METLMLSNLGGACFDNYRSTMCPDVQKLLKRTKERSSLNSYFNNNTAQIMWTGSGLVSDILAEFKELLLVNQEFRKR